MAASSSLKHPLCVQWTTELPVDAVSRRSPNISLMDSDWFFELTCDLRLKEYKLTLCHTKSMNIGLNEPIYVTTFVQDASILDKPILVERRSFSLSHATLWNKTSREIVDQIPDILGIGKFTIICLFNSTETHSKKTDASTQTAARLQTLSEDFTTFLEDEIFSDVKLICRDCTLSAHRCILSARSEVFAAMFRNKMAETEAGVVHIKDMDPEVLELLLKYVYSGQIQGLSESTARCLYKASDKYAIHSLRDACSEWMVEFQNTENCLDLLVLADEHSDEKFMEAVVCFTAEHLPCLSVKSWTTFKERYPLLVLPVLEKRLADWLPRECGVRKSIDTGCVI